MNYFTADLHLSSIDFIRDWFLPFNDIDSYISTIIGNINKDCSKNDKLYVIGDFIRFLDKDSDPDYMQNLELVRQLQPETYLVLGNNEQRLIESEFDNDYDGFMQVAVESGFKGVSKSLTMEMRGRAFDIVHNPEDAIGDLMTLHGHFHYMTAYTKVGLNVSIFQNWLRPMSEDMVFSRIDDFYRYHQGYEFVYNQEFDHEFWRRYSKEGLKG